MRLYLDILDSAEERGLERPASATPAELQIRLQEQFHTDATDEITALFQQARYAAREPDPALVDGLRRRWQSEQQA